MGVRNLDMARNNISFEKGQHKPRRFNISFVHVAMILLAIIVIFSVYAQRRYGGATLEKIGDIDKRIGDIENRLDRIESTDISLASIDEQRTKFEISLMNRIEGLESLITKKGSPETGDSDNVHREAVVKESDMKPETEKDKDIGGGIRYHQVLAGETLYRISLKYGITVEELRKLNNISADSVIYVGQKLIVSHTK